MSLHLKTRDDEFGIYRRTATTKEKINAPPEESLNLQNMNDMRDQRYFQKDLKNPRKKSLHLNNIPGYQRFMLGRRDNNVILNLTHFLSFQKYQERTKKTKYHVYLGLSGFFITQATELVREMLRGKRSQPYFNHIYTVRYCWFEYYSECLTRMPKYFGVCYFRYQECSKYFRFFTAGTACIRAYICTAHTPSTRSIWAISIQILRVFRPPVL